MKPINGTMNPLLADASSSGEAAMRATLIARPIGCLDRPEGQSLNGASYQGAVAQLGERSNRTAEVVGSIPSGSTINPMILVAG
jgi:hypothetical protein